MLFLSQKAKTRQNKTSDINNSTANREFKRIRIHVNYNKEM